MVFSFLIYLMMIRTISLYVFLTLLLSSAINCKKETSSPPSVNSPSPEKQNVVMAVDTTLTSGIIDNLLKPVYDTMNMKPLEEMDEEIQLSRSDIKRFVIGREKFAALVIENQYPFAGASTGHCDLFIFRFNGKNWETADFMIEAGSGGMYGNSGSLHSFTVIGKETVCFALSGGQTHMGTLYYDDLVIFSQNKLKKACTVTTKYSYGDWDDNSDETRFCYNVQYAFLPSEKAVYDLQLVKKSCLKEDKDQILDKIVVPFDNRDSLFKIPQSFDDNLP